eukprot:757231_1
MNQFEQSSYQFEQPMTQPVQPSDTQSPSANYYHTESGGLSSTDTGYASSDDSVKAFKTHLKCIICGLLMISPKSVENHRQLHFDEEGSHRCVVCSRVSNRKAAIKIHIRRHTGVKPFCCLTCHKPFTTNGQLSYHIQSHHNGQNGRFKCAECGKCFSLKSSLTQHLQSHVEGNFNEHSMNPGEHLANRFQQSTSQPGQLSDIQFSRLNYDHTESGGLSYIDLDIA